MLAGRRGKTRTEIAYGLVLALLIVAACHKPVPTYKVIAGKEGYTHRISKGETLESIAERYYGDKDLGKALGEYNAIDPLEPLEPGNTLLVPFDRGELDKIKSAQEAQMLYNRGTVLARTGQYDDAITYLEQAVEASPALVDAWYNLALAYQRIKRTSEARDILERLSDSFPSEPAYRYSLGAVLRDMGDDEEALKQFRKSLDLDPDYAEAQYALALTYEDLGKNAEAEREWRRYLELDSESVWSEEARVHLENLAR